MTKVTAPTMANSKKQIAPHEWRQISGDTNPGRYGAVVARFDGQAVDIFEIQPVLEHESTEGAAEVGYPFWTREAYYDADQLQVGAEGVDDALRSRGVEELPTDPAECKLVIAECLLAYGHGVDEGKSGWGKDVLPDEPVHWVAEDEPKGNDYFDDDDADFRREVLLPVAAWKWEHCPVPRDETAMGADLIANGVVLASCLVAAGELDIKSDRCGVQVDGLDADDIEWPDEEDARRAWEEQTKGG